MSDNYKTIRDPIHGDIKLEGLFLDLIQAPEIQRLHNIKQLGFAHLVFPGAHHTRLEHSLGTYYMGSKAADALKLDKDEKELITCSAFLHDIGHGPFSHTLESLLRESLNVDHVDLTEKLVLGEHAIFDENEKEVLESRTVFDILHKYDVDTQAVADIIKGKNKDKNYLNHLLGSSVDIDQLDYLIRDAYYTGVAYGIIDIERLLQTLCIFDNRLMVRRKGVSVVENVLMARSLMYSSVYYHKTVRIAELMLSKAIDLFDEADPFEFFKMTDGELISELKKIGGYQFEIASRLKYRHLFKQSYFASAKDLDESEIDVIKKMDEPNFRRKKERELEEKLNIPHGHVIIDVPYTELHLSEPRIDKTDTPILDFDCVKKLKDLTPLSDAIRSRIIPDWMVMIVVDEKYRDIVLKNASKILYK